MAHYYMPVRLASTIRRLIGTHASASGAQRSSPGGQRDRGDSYSSDDNDAEGLEDVGAGNGNDNGNGHGHGHGHGDGDGIGSKLIDV